MSKEAMIRARMEFELKADVEKIFAKLGLTTTEALTNFYKLVKINRGLPFDVRIPNKTTLKAMRDAESGRNVTRFENIDELIEKL